jgi:methionine--tRNA ligase beta chain
MVESSISIIKQTNNNNNNNKYNNIYQFERLGYFIIDNNNNDTTIETETEKTEINHYSQRSISKLKINQIVTLRDTWAVQTKAKSNSNSNSNSDSDSYSQSQSLSLSHSNSNHINSNLNKVEDILRVEFKVGLIKSVINHPNSNENSLYICEIDFNSKTTYTVVSNLAKYMDIKELIDKKVVVITNMKPSKIRGIMSEGMILCSFIGNDYNKQISILKPPCDAEIGEILTIEDKAAPQPDIVLKSKTAQECFKRVMSCMSVNTDGEVVYVHNNNNNEEECSEGKGERERGYRLMSKAGVVMSALQNAQIG